MSKSPAAATPGQVGKRSTHMLQEKVDVDPEDPAMKRQRMNQQECQTANSSSQAGHVTDRIRTRSNNYQPAKPSFECTHESHSDNNQSALMDQAELSSLNVSHEPKMGVANPMAGFTSVLGRSQNTPQPMMSRSTGIHENTPSTSPNEENDVIYCSRCCFWSQTAESFHEHLYQCDKRLSCSACGFRGTRMDVLDHIRECVTGVGQSAACCISLDFAIPDNKYNDLRQPIPGRGFYQYGFVQEIEEEPKINLVQVWKPMDAIPNLDSFSHENRLEEEALNLQKEKDSIKIQLEESFRRIVELEKALSEKSSHANKLEIQEAFLRNNASNEDQDKAMKLAAQNRLIMEKLKSAASLKEESETAQSALLEKVKALKLKYSKSNSKEAARALQEAEKKLKELDLEVDEKRKIWSILFPEANMVSRQLNDAVKATAKNIDRLFSLNNSLFELNSEIDRMKDQIEDLKSSIPKLLQSRSKLNEALLEISLKKMREEKSAEFRQQEVSCLEEIGRQFGYL